MKLHQYIVLALLSALLTLVGFGSCKTSKMAERQRQRQIEAERQRRQAYEDSVSIAQAIEREEAARRRQILDSLRQDSIARSHKAIYGGPTMMDRRFGNDQQVK